jgi:flagellar biosynthesis GTPase FlhF
MKFVEGVKRVYSFVGSCTMIEAMLPRISGLPQILKSKTAAAIRGFLSAMPLRAIFDMKHTLVHTYIHCLKMTLEYNSKINIDVEWACSVVDNVVDDDNILVTGATIRLVAILEKLLNKTPRVKAIKPAVPLQVLHKQFEATWRKQKSEFYRKAKRARAKTVGALLAKRNDDPTDEERAQKRRRREDLKVLDREERQLLRQQRLSSMTAEEKAERRKRLTAAKQDRIARNRDRKMRVHETRERAFQKWKSAKLASSDDA